MNLFIAPVFRFNAEVNYVSYTIITDGACSITEPMRKWKNLQIVPIQQTKAHTQETTAVRTALSDLFFTAIAESDGDVYIVPAAQKLADSYRSAQNAKIRYLDQYGESKNIFVFDTPGIGGMEAIAAMKIKMLADSGADFKAVITLTQYYLTNKTVYYLCPNGVSTLVRAQLLPGVKPAAAQKHGVKRILMQGRDGCFACKLQTKLQGRLFSGFKKEVLSIVEAHKNEALTILVSRMPGQAPAGQLENRLRTVFPTAKIITVPCSETEQYYLEHGGFTISVAV